MYHISIATQSLFLETNQILIPKKKKKKILTVIKFKKIYYFEGKIGDVEKNINFVKKNDDNRREIKK